MENKLKYSLIGGMILTLIMILFQIITFLFCKSEFLCLIINFIPTIPGSLIGLLFGFNLVGFYLILINLIIYFLIGAVIGYFVQRFRNK